MNSASRAEDAAESLGRVPADAGRISPGIFRPLTVRKAVDEVVSVIIDALHGGLVEPGQRLPREADLAARLEVSRNTVSEALGRLERAGVVSIKRGNRGGAFVQTRLSPPDLLIGDREPAEIVKLLQVRRPLETQATLLTVAHAKDADLSELRRLVAVLPSLVRNPDEFIAVDLQFHASLGRLSGNLVLATYMEDLFRRILVLRSQYPSGRVDLDTALENQRRSLKAIESRERATVLDATDEHLGSVEEHYLGARLSAWMPAGENRPDSGH
jgi:GntR family transcriptional repressor for pyruvate dehydrogenase complex